MFCSLQFFQTSIQNALTFFLHFLFMYLVYVIVVVSRFRKYLGNIREESHCHSNSFREYFIIFFYKLRNDFIVNQT